MKLTAALLNAACADDAYESGVAIRCVLDPLGGAGAPVKPAVYAGGQYQLDQRWVAEGDDVRSVQAIVIDNVPSQANRLEAALMRLAGPVGLPQFILDLSDCQHLPPHIPSSLSSFQFPHRNADAYLRDSLLDGVPFLKSAVGAAVFAATPARADDLVRYMPQALLFGFWQSHLGKKGAQTKLARAWTSEIVGFEPGSTDTRRLGVKGDPLNLSIDQAVSFDSDDLREWELVEGKTKAGSKSKDSLAEVGHGQVPVTGPDAPLGAVSFRRIEQLATVSFAQLRNVHASTPEASSAMRALLVAMGVLAHAAAFGSGFTLRSGADLVRTGSIWTWKGEVSDDDIDVPTVTEAKSLFSDAVAQAEAAGLPVGDWGGDPIELKPNAALSKVLAQTFPDLDQ
jgi:CRISPR-associated protein Csb1